LVASTILSFSAGLRYLVPDCSRANNPVGQRARYMTLETISTLSDDPAVSLAAIAR
jgi:hypothetical protein